jgi:hypothetical protein
MLISNDLIKLLDEAFPLEAFNKQSTMEAVAKVQGQREVVDFLKSKQEEVNEEAMTGGDQISITSK